MRGRIGRRVRLTVATPTRDAGCDTHACRNAQTLAAGRPADPPNSRPAVGRHATHRGCAPRVSCRPRGPATGRGELPRLVRRCAPRDAGGQPRRSRRRAQIFTDIFDARFPIRSDAADRGSSVGTTTPAWPPTTPRRTTAGRRRRPTRRPQLPSRERSGSGHQPAREPVARSPVRLLHARLRGMPSAPRARAESLPAGMCGEPSRSAAGSGRTFQRRTTSTSTPATPPGRR